MSTRIRRYTLTEVRRFVTARYAVRVLGATYAEVGILLGDPAVPLVAGESLQEMARAIADRSALEFEQWAVEKVPRLRERREGTTKQQLMERYGLGLTAVRSTLNAAGLSCQYEQYDLEQERAFATVRYWVEVDGLLYDRAAAKFSDPTAELIAGESPEDWVRAIAAGRPQGLTREQLGRQFGIGERALRETLRCCGLLEAKRFGPEDLKLVRKARRLLRSGLPYRKVGRLLGKGETGVSTKGLEISKRQLMARYDVSLSAVRETLLACGFSGEACRYDLEQERQFATARYWLQVVGLSYEAIRQKFAEGAPLLEGEMPQDWMAALERPPEKRLTKKQLCQKLGVGPYPLRVSMWAAGLDTSQKTYDPQEVQRLEAARRGIADWGMSFAEVAVLLGKDEGGISRVKDGCSTKRELGERFGLGPTAVWESLWAAGLPTKRRRYEPQQVQQFVRVRRLRDLHQLSYWRIASILRSGEADSWLSEDCQPGAGMTKRQLGERYGLKPEAVLKTFRACGVETWKRVHYGVDLLRFDKARRMVDSGSSLAAVAEYFKLSLRSAEAS